MTLKAIFFDAAGTLIYLPQAVGEHYRMVALRFGAELDAAALDAAFKRAWSAAPSRPSSHGARVDDDKGWWKQLVQQVLRLTLTPAQKTGFDEEAYFEAVYAHFTEPGVWQVFNDVVPALQALRRRDWKLGVISNFDRRLYPIFEGLRLRHYFDAMIISSEVGADKPDPAIFQAALAALEVAAPQAMHVGDDPKRDWGAASMGLQVFELERPARGLAAFVQRLEANGLLPAE